MPSFAWPSLPWTFEPRPCCGHPTPGQATDLAALFQVAVVMAAIPDLPTRRRRSRSWAASDGGGSAVLSAPPHAAGDGGVRHRGPRRA